MTVQHLTLFSNPGWVITPNLELEEGRRYQLLPSLDVKLKKVSASSPRDRHSGLEGRTGSVSTLELDLTLTYLTPQVTAKRHVSQRMNFLLGELSSEPVFGSLY